MLHNQKVKKPIQRLLAMLMLFTPWLVLATPRDKPPASEPQPLPPGIAAEIRNDRQFESMAALGKKVFHDGSLSIPAGQSCATCHDAKSGFDEPDDQFPTSQGALGKDTFGRRNAPTISYAAWIPEPQFAMVGKQGRFFIGGQFWDGRAKNLLEQAKAPFLDPLEMNHPDVASVVSAVQATSYAPEFIKLFGAGIFNNKEKAYDAIARVIAAFELTPVFSPFNSKYDAVKKGEDKFTKEESRGEKLFHEKAQCARCHFTPENFGPQVFSTFQYFNVGTPPNPENRFMDKQPEFIDIGRAEVSGKSADKGLFRIPTLRNVEKTAPYLHNGVFATLEEVVKFYSNGGAAPEVGATVTDDGFYNTGISLEKQDISDIVAFLKTLTDRE